MGKSPDLSDYVEVADRVVAFHAAHPTGTLQSSHEYFFDKASGAPTLVVVEARAYRTPDDERPGVGRSAMQIPGKTSFTRDSELENCETSAWGRAIVAVGAATAKKIASREEVRNRSAEPDNLDGLKAIGDLCAEKGWTSKEQKVAVANAFLAKYRVVVDRASNDDLGSFAALVKEGAITIHFDDPF